MDESDGGRLWSDGGGEASDSEADFCCKYARISHKYDIQDRARELPEQWGPDDDLLSIRDITAEFNKAVLRSTLEETGAMVLAGEVEMLYEALADTDADSARHTTARERLAFQGVDVDELEDDFISRHVVHSHLREHLELETTFTRGASPTDALTKVRRWHRNYRDRQIDLVTDWVEYLTRHDVLPHADYEALLTVDVRCNECGAHLGFLELIRQGCECGGGAEELPNVADKPDDSTAERPADPPPNGSQNDQH